MHYYKQQVASELGIGYSVYNKLEIGKRECFVMKLRALVKLFNLSAGAIC